VAIRNGPEVSSLAQGQRFDVLYSLGSNGDLIMKNPLLIAMAVFALIGTAIPAQARDGDFENHGRHLGWYHNGMNGFIGDRDDWRARHWTSNNYWNNGWNNNNLNFWQQQRMLRRQQLGSRWRNRWY
jgi:hypothetical protein